MRWASLFVIASLSASALAQTPPLIVGRDDFDCDREDTVEKASLAPIAASIAIPGPLQQHPGLGASGTMITKQPDAAGLIVRFAADPEHPYLLIAASRAAMLERIGVEVRPPGQFATTGVGVASGQMVSSEHDSVYVVNDAPRPAMIKIWDAKKRDFVGHWLKPS